MLVAVSALPVSCLKAQAIPAFEDIKSQAELDKAGAALDAALFDAYNRCDLARFSSFLDDNVEFYHDRGGVTLGKDKLTDSVKNNICGGDVRRELVPGTLKNYHRITTWTTTACSKRARIASTTQVERTYGRG